MRIPQAVQLLEPTLSELCKLYPEHRFMLITGCPDYVIYRATEQTPEEAIALLNHALTLKAFGKEVFVPAPIVEEDE